jgi:hypothetical protein
MHIGANANGANRDWVGVSFYRESNDMGDSTPWSPWKPFEDEIFLVNVKTKKVRRLAHHRSRNVTNNYWRYSVGSISADGSVLIFNSNMGRSEGNYVDAYTVTTDFDADISPINPIAAPAPPKNLKIIQ